DEEGVAVENDDDDSSGSDEEEENKGPGEVVSP
ncbi:hypothetical protein A2U01_0076171, partial [Trifolium medium]|nr:hypothetical protein [Trifolium medium]